MQSDIPPSITSGVHAGLTMIRDLCRNPRSWSPIRSGPGRWFFHTPNGVVSSFYSKSECHRQMHFARMAQDADYRSRIQHNQLKMLEKVTLRREQAA